MGSFLKSLLLASLLSFVYHFIASSSLPTTNDETSSNFNATADVAKLFRLSPFFLLLLNFFVIANFLAVYESVESFFASFYITKVSSASSKTSSTRESESKRKSKKSISPGSSTDFTQTSTAKEPPSPTPVAAALTTTVYTPTTTHESEQPLVRRISSSQLPIPVLNFDTNNNTNSGNLNAINSDRDYPNQKSNNETNESNLNPNINSSTGNTNTTNNNNNRLSPHRHRPQVNTSDSLSANLATSGSSLSSNVRMRKFKTDRTHRHSIASISTSGLSSSSVSSIPTNSNSGNIGEPSPSSPLNISSGSSRGPYFNYLSLSASPSPSASPSSSLSSSEGNENDNDDSDGFYFESDTSDAEDEGNSGSNSQRLIMSSNSLDGSNSLPTRRFSMYSSSPSSSMSYLVGKRGQAASHLRANISSSSPLLTLKSTTEGDLTAASAALSNLANNNLVRQQNSSESSISNSAESSPRRMRKGSLIIQDKVKWYDDLVRERKLRQELLDSIQSNSASLSEEQANTASSRHLRITSSSPFISEVVTPDGSKRKTSSEVIAKTNEETDQQLLEQELRALMKERKVKLNLKEFNSRRTPTTEGISWSSLGSNTKEVDVCGHTSTSFGNTLIVLGGKPHDSEKSRVEVNLFDTETNTWSTLSRFTGLKIGNMWNHQTVRVGDRLYSFGGYVEGKLSNDVFIMSLRDDGSAHWSKIRQTTDIPSAREGHTLSRYGKKFFLFGGYNGQEVLNDMNVLNTETGVWTKVTIKEGEEPPPRRGHAAVVLDNKLVVFGGLGRNEENYNDVWIFNLDELSWEQCKSEGTQPLGVYELAMARIGKRAMIFGGKRLDHCTNGVFLLSISESSSKLRISWTAIPGNCPTARRSHSLNCVNGNLYVLGGKTQNDGLCRDIWIGDIVNMPFVATHIDYSSLKIKEKIAEGNFAIVHRAIWKGTEVAVKKFKRKKDPKEDTKALKDFKTEVELLSLVCHPNVMAILGYCHEKQRCIVMEYLPNNLYDFIHEQTSPIAPELMLQLASDIVRGVKYLHSQRIIHRDLKSSNLLLDRHLNVKIGDLGISRVVSLTNTMTTIGTIAWTAPEILRHEPYDERADIYSFSIVLWELCTRRVPYEDEQKNPMEIGVLVANRSISRPKIDPAVVAPEYATLIEKCWSESPAHRPSFAEIEQYLNNTF